MDGSIAAAAHRVFQHDLTVAADEHADGLLFLPGLSDCP
jgi:hypothetical protein